MTNEHTFDPNNLVSFILEDKSNSFLALGSSLTKIFYEVCLQLMSDVTIIVAMQCDQ